MIVDSIKNAGTYGKISARLKMALDYLSTVKADGFKEQTIELDGKNVYAMHQAYATEGEAGRFYENHDKYIDVQYVVEGEEIIRVADVSGMKATTEYNVEKDFTLYGLVDGTDVKLNKGDFAVLFTQDAHVPKLIYGKACKIKKVVVKVLAE